MNGRLAYSISKLPDEYGCYTATVTINNHPRKYVGRSRRPWVALGFALEAMNEHLAELGSTVEEIDRLLTMPKPIPPPLPFNPHG